MSESDYPGCRELGVLQITRPDTRWLSTGANGGFQTGSVAYNCTVPEDWNPEDISADVAQRLEDAGFDADGPALVTGVDQHHAHGARTGPVTAYATVGLSNPAELPIDPGERAKSETAGHTPPGTVNLIVGTTRALTDAGMANLVACVAEARTATLLELAGFTGTTSDAIVIGSDPAGELVRYTGSATEVGRAARACVREAITASFRSRYADTDPPASVADAEHGTITAERAEVFRI